MDSFGIARDATVWSPTPGRDDTHLRRPIGHATIIEKPRPPSVDLLAKGPTDSREENERLTSHLSF